MGRATQGVKVIRLGNKDAIADVTVVKVSDEEVPEGENGDGADEAPQAPSENGQDE